MCRQSLQLACRALLMGAVALACALGCGAPADGAYGDDDVVTVRPRVAIDGLIELSSRTAGRLFVDEVVIHAPLVEVREGGAVLANVLATDPHDSSALFFRYALAEAGASHSAIAGERQWRLNPPGATDGSRLVFGFSPFTSTPSGLEELAARYGYDFGDLEGYTAYVHGYVAVDDGPALLTSFAAGDPDTDPAKGHDAAGDPDTDPAKGHDAAGDPDTDPAKGKPVAGDPDTDPARSLVHRASMDFGERGPVDLSPSGRTGQLVPFLLVFEDGAEIGVPLLHMGRASLGDDEYLPIELHVDVNRLLSRDRLDDLQAEAKAVLAGRSGRITLPMAAAEASAALELQLQPEQVRERPGTPSSPGLDVQGDRRSEH
jgi:hypothetical protein